jgi:hypothetical protein
MGLVQLCVFIFCGLFLLLYFFKVFVEPAYVFFFNKPMYIHWYPLFKKLSANQKRILEKEFPFYKKLSAKRKAFFEHRTASFITNYKFLGHKGFVLTDQIKVLIAATFVMLTFGMRRYLVSVFDKIIVYPDAYFSTINQEYHKGEYNPMMKAVVFSWDDFQEGFRIENDNLNLGLHEFAHVLYFHGLKSRDQSSVVFSDTYDKIKQYIQQTEVRDKLVQSNYFRIYAFTNQVEFIAVVLEHFFETPAIFKQEFPELYLLVKSMINYNELDGITVNHTRG